MATASCIPSLFPGLAIVETKVAETEIFLSLQSTEASAACSRCGAVSKRVHSSYLRHVQDTPIGLFIVWLQLKVRRFRCDNPKCNRQTFAEQYPDLVGRRRRRTNRLLLQLFQIGLALGGAAGAKLAGKLAMAASGSTILRLLHQMEAPLTGQPRVIGIDDWAFRKGRNYGTIIVDHESGRPIELLPQRDSKTVREWLEQHPAIEVVTRDRSGEYRDAITEALPEAIQIADRWHLLKNLGKAVQRYFSRRRKTIRQLVVDAVETEGFEQDDLDITEKYRRYCPGPSREALHKARTEEREALFAAVKARHAAGGYTTDIAKEFNLSRPTVSRWVNSETLPPDARGRYKRECLIDEYVPYLHRRIEAGCTNKSQLWREIKGQGFTGSRTLVGKWVRQNYDTNGDLAKKLPTKKVELVVPSSRKLAWLIICHTDELEEDEKPLLEVLLSDTEIAELRQAAHEFMHMVRNGLGEEWSSWLKSCCNSAVKELKSFALGLKRDGAAVYEAIRQSWSNGPTEGHVNRLKFLKRQMYGRSSFELLRLRVLLAEWRFLHFLRRRTMKGDMVAARRGVLVDVLADGRPHTRETLWQTVEAQLGRECWGARPAETLWRDMKALRAGGLRIAYARRPGIEGYYLQHPPIERPSPRRREPTSARHLAGIGGMTVTEKNRQTFSAAAFALRQKRLLLAQEHPGWDEDQVDTAARRLVYGRHETP